MVELLHAKQAAQILREAQNVLRERGWIQFEVELPTGVCAMGAVNSATDRLMGDEGITNDWACAAGDAIAALHWEILREARRSIGITGWNDAPERTIEDVFVMFKRAEERCREQSA